MLINNIFMEDRIFAKEIKLYHRLKNMNGKSYIFETL